MTGSLAADLGAGVSGLAAAGAGLGVAPGGRVTAVEGPGADEDVAIEVLADNPGGMLSPDFAG